MTCDSYHTTVLCMYRTAAAIQCSDGVYGILCGRVAYGCVSVSLCVWVGWVCVWVCVCVRFEVSVCVASDRVCPPGTAVQLSSSAAIQVFAFVFLHNRRRSSVRSVAVVVMATAAAVSVDRAYIEEPSTPPSSGRRELGRRRLPVLLDEVFPEPVAVDDQAEDGCRWRRWRRQLQR